MSMMPNLRSLVAQVYGKSRARRNFSSSTPTSLYTKCEKYVESKGVEWFAFRGILFAVGCFGLGPHYIGKKTAIHEQNKAIYKLVEILIEKEKEEASHRKSQNMAERKNSEAKLQLRLSQQGESDSQVELSTAEIDKIVFEKLAKVKEKISCGVSLNHGRSSSVSASIDQDYDDQLQLAITWIEKENNEKFARLQEDSNRKYARLEKKNKKIAKENADLRDILYQKFPELRHLPQLDTEGNTQRDDDDDDDDETQV